VATKVLNTPLNFSLTIRLVGLTFYLIGVKEVATSLLTFELLAGVISSPTSPPLEESESLRSPGWDTEEMAISAFSYLME
jgi:uncharacterized membrane protein